MAKSFSGDVGAFLPTTPRFDVSRIRSMKPGGNEFKDFLVDLYQTINNIALVTNIKDSAIYYEQEFATGAIYFPNPALDSTTPQTPVQRQVVRNVVDFGALPNNTNKTVAHNITIEDPKSVVRLYGAATNPSTKWISIPFSSPTLDENIKLEVDTTDIIITTGIDYSAYTKCYIVIEYLTS